jgi:general transcription factor 3C polypeptide 5 (transcription factor C subunit 1)
VFVTDKKPSFKANPASVVTTVTDTETGEEKKRYINRMRWKGLGPASINFADKGVNMCRGPWICMVITFSYRYLRNRRKLLKSIARKLIRSFLGGLGRQVSPLICRVTATHVYVRAQLFEDRPVWTRTAIFNQFNAHEVREIIKQVSSIYAKQTSPLTPIR